MSIATFGDLVEETCTGTGVGPVTLTGATDALHFAVGSQLVDGDNLFYTLWDGDGSGVEVGQGQFASGTNSIARNFVEKSTNSDDFLDLSGSPHLIQISFPASVANFLAQGAVGMRRGCEVYYDLTTGYRVTPGALSIGNQVYENTANVVGTGLTGYTATSTVFLYAYAATNKVNFEIEESVTAPEQAADGTWQKTGDNSRRLLLWFRTDGVGTMIPFGSIYADRIVAYLYAAPLVNTLVFDNTTTADTWLKLALVQTFAPISCNTISLQPQITLAADNDEVRLHLSGFDPSPLGITSTQASNIISYTASKNTSSAYGNNIEMKVDPVDPSVWLWVTQVTGTAAVDLAVAKVEAYI